MREYIQSPEFQQLIINERNLLFFIAVGAVVIILAVLALPLAALAQWRLFTITHHHYHQASSSPAAQQPNIPPGFYRVDVYGRYHPVSPELLAPVGRSPRAPSADVADLYYGVQGIDYTPAEVSDDDSGEWPPYATQAPSKRKIRRKISSSKRFRILQRDSFRCRLCGRQANEKEGLELHIDHKLPLAKGGTDDEDNLWTLCNECNGAKSDAIIAEIFNDAAEPSDEPAPLDIDSKPKPES